MAKNIFQKLYYQDLNRVYKRFSGIILDSVIGDIPDLQNYFVAMRSQIKPDAKILISYHNNLWEPVLTLASKFGLRRRVGIQNWLDEKDVRNILDLSGFEVISTTRRFFGIATITIARPVHHSPSIVHQFSVSIIIPARQEEANISKIVPSIPKFGKSQEIIFIEGHSKDNTWNEITHLRRDYGEARKVKAFKQKGIGKADAVWLGFEKAKGDILIIYDADRTVDASDLPKFYHALAEGLGEFANGSRMVYPMEQMAMQTLNKIANTIFGSIFTWILGQRFRDTLCGTKALFRSDYLYMRSYNKQYFKMDPFGDFALIFGAIKNNLKVIEIPVRYKERVYGSTNISRFKHGLALLKMTVAAFKEFRAW